MCKKLSTFHKLNKSEHPSRPFYVFYFRFLLAVRLLLEARLLRPISTPESSNRYGTVWYVFFCSQKIILHVNKKYILRTKENVPYRTVPVETFRSGYWP